MTEKMFNDSICEYVCFRADKSDFIVPFSSVYGVANVRDVAAMTSIPRSGKYIRFVAMFGDEIISIIHFPEIADRNYAEEKNIVLLSYKGRKVGIPANQVGILRAKPFELKEDRINGITTIKKSGCEHILIKEDILFSTVENG